jgi:hypothetical protein
MGKVGGAREVPVISASSSIGGLPGDGQPSQQGDQPRCSRASASCPRSSGSRYGNSSSPPRSSVGGAGRAARRTPAGPQPPSERGTRCARSTGLSPQTRHRRPATSRAAAQTPGRNENAAAASCVARPRRDGRVHPSARPRRHGGRWAFGRGWAGQAWPFSPDRHGSCHVWRAPASSLAGRAHGSPTRRFGSAKSACRPSRAGYSGRARGAHRLASRSMRIRSLRTSSAMRASSVRVSLTTVTRSAGTTRFSITGTSLYSTISSTPDGSASAARGRRPARRWVPPRCGSPRASGEWSAEPAPSRRTCASGRDHAVGARCVLRAPPPSG